MKMDKIDLLIEQLEERIAPAGVHGHGSASGSKSGGSKSGSHSKSHGSKSGGSKS